MGLLSLLERGDGALEALDRRLGARRGLLGAGGGGLGAPSGSFGPPRLVVVRAGDADGGKNEDQRDQTHEGGRYAACAGRSNPGRRGVTARRSMTTVRRPMTGREALLQAFDRLFDAASRKLNVVCTPEERAEAKEQFASRFDAALKVAEKVEVSEIPTGVIETMENAIAQLSPAELAGVIASVPLAQQTQEMLRAIAFRQVEQRLLEHYALQADDRYGGN